MSHLDDPSGRMSSSFLEKSASSSSFRAKPIVARIKRQCGGIRLNCGETKAATILHTATLKPYLFGLFELCGNGAALKRSTLMAKHDATTPYKVTLANWSVKTLGPKPTLAQFEATLPFVKVPGKQALAMAMAQRDCGVTAGQMKAAAIAQWGNAGPSLNKMGRHGEVVKAGYFKFIDGVKSAHNHVAYKLELTAKGAAKVAKVQAPAEATEAPAKVAKPRKAKAVKQLPAPVAAEATEAPAAQ